MKEIKFRAWDETSQQMMTHLDLGKLNILHLSECLPPNITLLQFTGLYDKNEQEIYEGHIVKVEIEQITDTLVTCGVVEIGLTETRVDFPQHGASVPIKHCMDEWVEGIEVVGNIYENPEMVDAE